MDPRDLTTGPPARVQQARFAAEAGGRTRMTAEVSVTSAGILAVGALISSILLSSAVIVWAAKGRPRG